MAAAKELGDVLKYFRGSAVFTLVCLALAAWLGFSTGGATAALATTWICLMLAVLEISLSFDNAVVNAVVLKDMDPVWQKRFLTWGMLIAVFGMRILFPLLIVAVAAKIGPIEALRLAIEEPVNYQHIIEGAHAGIMGFGGAFLLLVGLKFFFDSDKEHDWIKVIEEPLKKFSNVEAFKIVLTVAALFLVAELVDDPATGRQFLIAGILGIVTFFAVELLGHVLEQPRASGELQRAGLGAFMYLQVLDASFSFDGVIGAFALSNNLFVIALGLAIGAMFVRTLTILMVERETLAEYRYLEHGAFWAIIVLAVIMLTSVLYEVPEVVTGLIGALLIGLSLVSSVKHNRKHGADDVTP